MTDTPTFQDNEIPIVFGFYEAACNTFGYEQTISSAEELGTANESILAEVAEVASEAGFQISANKSHRAFENLLLQKKVNLGKPKIWTSFYGHFDTFTAYNVVPIRVAQYAPRYKRKHDAFLSLAPSKAMLAEAKSGNYDHVDWKKRFLRDVLGPLDPHEVYAQLIKLGKGFDVAILCYEKPGDRCHRHYVTEWLAEAGYEIAEFPTKGDAKTATAMLFSDDELTDD